MNGTARQVKRWIKAVASAARWKNRKALDDDCHSLVGAMPSVSSGKAGSSDLRAVFFELLAEYQPETLCEIGSPQADTRRRALSVCPEATMVAIDGLPSIGRVAGLSQRDNRLPVLHRLYLRLKADIATVAESRHRLGASRRVRARPQVDAILVSAQGTVGSLDDFLRDHGPIGRVALWVDMQQAGSLVGADASMTLGRTDLMLVKVTGFDVGQKMNTLMPVIQALQQQGLSPLLRDREYGDRHFTILLSRRDAGHSDRQARIGRALDAKSPPSKGRLRRSLTPESVPIFVPCFNNHTYAGQMLEQLQALNFSDITFVDNASNSEAMRHWLDLATESGIRVERLSQNLGPRVSIFTPERLGSLPRWFCVTDPDLGFNPALPDGFLETMASEARRYRIAKVGFALNISNRFDLWQEPFQIGDRACKIWEWERGFWEKRLDFTPGGDPVFRASVDTTFALYDRKRFRQKRFLRGLRIGGRFTADHLPWHVQPTVSLEEAETYRSTQKFSYFAR